MIISIIIRVIPQIYHLLIECPFGIGDVDPDPDVLLFVGGAGESTTIGFLSSNYIIISFNS